ncbi:MAG: toluene tolerance protein [Colwelliaceae bacterium]|nr:toluene tolerance protein [Colwelliaceae bacterium]|tara:strand:- start:20 stop:649 length:630 start_codon:yes stop_codon:yes gene_type:complete
MRVLLFTLFSLFLSASALAEVDKSNPYEMVQTVADITFKRVATEQSAIKKDPNLLKTIVKEELLPYIDYRYAALKVIGRNIKSTTAEERKAFIPVFRDYLVTSYAQVFTLYNNQEVRFDPAKKLDKEKIVMVKTVVIEPGRDPIDISFKVRNNRKKNEWKAFDMVAEGVSLLDSKQSELNSIIRQKGLTHVTEMLREKATRDVVFKDGI